MVNVESGVIKRSIQARNRAFGNTEQGRLEPVLRHFVCGSMPGALELDHIESFSRNVNHFDSSGGIDTSGAGKLVGAAAAAAPSAGGGRSAANGEGIAAVRADDPPAIDGTVGGTAATAAPLVVAIVRSSAAAMGTPPPIT